jgi:four helix bundle protein
MARGSFEETKCWLRKAIRRKVISQELANQLAEIINKPGPKLNSFIKSQNVA